MTDGMCHGLGMRDILRVGWEFVRLGRAQSTLFLNWPTLILNAKNDSFLSDKSYPYEIAKNHKFVHLETPKYGGHVAFWQPGNVYYNEERALEFSLEHL